MSDSIFSLMTKVTETHNAFLIATYIKNDKEKYKALEKFRSATKMLIGAIDADLDTLASDTEETEPE